MVHMFFLVTGASGAGKSTVRRAIAPALEGRVDCVELGTLGITPEWSLEWRQRTVEHVVQVALEAARHGRHFLLCGDPVPPGEVVAAPSGHLDVWTSACWTWRLTRSARACSRAATIPTCSRCTSASQSGCAITFRTRTIGPR